MQLELTQKLINAASVVEFEFDLNTQIGKTPLLIHQDKFNCFRLLSQSEH